MWPIVEQPDATKVVTTIPQEKAITYTDHRNTIAAEIDRSTWAHKVMNDIQGMAYQTPIWKSRPYDIQEYDVTHLQPTGFKNGKLPGYKNGKEDEDEFGINIGKVIGTTISQNAEKIKRANNIKTDSKISEQTNYGWKNVMRTPFHTDSQAKVQINPAWRIGAYGAALIAKITGKADMSDATKDDISFWNRHIGYPRDYESMPVTGIRFSGDYNKDGSARLPLAEYSGLSKTAKNFIRDGIKSGDIKVNKDGSWQVVDEARGRYGKYTSHLGSYSIRENNGSGIYDVYDTYDFPWYSGVFNRDEGKQIEIRDSIWGNNAKPQYYDPLFSANQLKQYKDGKIAIKPANRGKFNATKKRTGKTTEELTHNKNPITRKRAIFAQNAKKWKH